jgi:uncharacterized protein
MLFNHHTYNSWRGLLLLSAGLVIACRDSGENRLATGRNSQIATAQKVSERIRDTMPSPMNPYVNDFEAVFTRLQADSLMTKMIAISKSGAIVFCVVTIDSSQVKPDQFDNFTFELANYWGVGDRGKNNGIVICFSKLYRRLRIQNGKGIERIISDQETDSLMKSVIFPNFKAGDYYRGVNQGIDAMTELIRTKKSWKQNS